MKRLTAPLTLLAMSLSASAQADSELFTFRYVPNAEMVDTNLGFWPNPMMSMIKSGEDFSLTAGILCEPYPLTDKSAQAYYNWYFSMPAQNKPAQTFHNPKNGNVIRFRYLKNGATFTPGTNWVVQDRYVIPGSASVIQKEASPSVLYLNKGCPHVSNYFVRVNLFEFEDDYESERVVYFGPLVNSYLRFANPIPGYFGDVRMRATVQSGAEYLLPGSKIQILLWNNG